jgi:hypothetical protein
MDTSLCLESFKKTEICTNNQKIIKKKNKINIDINEQENIIDVKHDKNNNKNEVVCTQIIKKNNKKNNNKQEKINEELLINLSQCNISSNLFSTNELQNIIKYLKCNLTIDCLQELSNKCNAINDKCKKNGSGSGLLGGCLIDMFITDFFKKKLCKYEEYHYGEADLKLCNTPLSLKKITGKSDIALDWSKNKDNFIKEHFIYHIIIINLKTEQWWKKTPKIHQDNIIYNDNIESGIYIINKEFCKQFELFKNNKTNTLIKNHDVYKMLKESISHNLYIKIPPHNKIVTFDILNAFSQ